MIIDCFPYFNERELLELRINLLFDKVDKFMIMEGNHTHSGEPKKLNLFETLQDLNLPYGWESKIFYIPVSMPNFFTEPNPWVRERMQRDAAIPYINDNDIVIVSDCDEIINPDFLEYYCNVAKINPSNILRIPMAFLCSKANLRVCDINLSPVSWCAPFIGLSHHFKKYTLSRIRESYALGKNDIEFKDIFAIDDGIIKEAGWHFTWMGDKNRAEIKLKSFLHWDEVNLVDNYIAKEGATDLLGRKDHILKSYNLKNLPDKIFELDTVRDFLLPDLEISVVQLGTNKANDSLSELILQKYAKLKLGIFVEANPAHINDIKTCYSRYKNILVENVAIKKSLNDPAESLTFYVNSNDGPDYEIASTDINHIYKHMEIVPHLIGGTIESFDVPCISLEQLLEKYNVKELDLLVMDLEGMDGDVILNFDFSKYDIKKIEFEQLHLGEKRESVIAHLINHGYSEVNPVHEFNCAFIK